MQSLTYQRNAADINASSNNHVEAKSQNQLNHVESRRSGSVKTAARVLGLQCREPG